MSAILQEMRSRVSKNIRPIGKSGEYAYSSPKALIVPESISERLMTADFNVVMPVEDREWDTIDPQGCLKYLDEYRRNPVVLLEHDALMPVGLSEDGQGNFSFRVSPLGTIARCFFHGLPLHGNNLSEEMFHLVVKGVFRGASPGFLPIRAKKRGYGKDSGMEYSEWRLTEWSITTQPVNQDALRLSLPSVRCKSLRKSLECLVLPQIKANSVVGGWGSPLFKSYGDARVSSTASVTVHRVGAKSMKPKTASIEFDKDVFADEAACVAWLDSHGKDSSSCTPLPTSFVFKQGDGKPDAGKKSLGKGVTALLTKAFGKEDDEKKKKPDEKAEKPPEKSAPKEDGDDEPDLEDGDEEGDEPDSEDETPEEGKDTSEDETEYEPEALKKEANNLIDMIAHFEIACEHAERMKGESVKSPELFTKLHADATALTKDLRAAYKDGFADQAMECAIEDRKAGAVAQEDTPADTAEPNEYDEAVKAMGDALKATKSWPKVA